jgi:hypothetical protein
MPLEIKEYHKKFNDAISRLRVTRDCKTIDLSAPHRQRTEDTACAIFHPDGANIEYLYFYQSCPSGDHLKTLAIGDSCGAIVYAGDHMSQRLYTTMYDLPSQSWNNGDKLWAYTNSTSMHDGMTNTDILTQIEDDGAPYKAAHSCRDLGPEWYLPSSSELQILYDNRHAIGNFTIDGVFPDGIYWSSTESNASNAYHFNFRNGFESTRLKLFHFSIRCVRR